MAVTSDADITGTAARIHRDLPVVDGHNDLPWELRLEGGDLPELTSPLPRFHTDFARLRRGGVGGQFWSVFVPCDHPEPFATTVQQIDLVKRFAATHPDAAEMADTAGDVRRITAGGRLASLLGAEGGHCIEGSLDRLRELRRCGVRYLTLTHTESHDWADSATGERRHGGLSAFGREVVVEMNRIGMLVDISHVSTETMCDALATSTRPLIASHSNAHALAPHPRNIPDDVLGDIAVNGDVVMVAFYPPFVVPATAEAAWAQFQASRIARSQGVAEADITARELRERQGWNRGTVEDVADHVEHIAEVAGVDHVGIGSDFDGIEVTIEGLDDVSTFPTLTTELLRRGWDEDSLRKLLGGNVLRVLEAADDQLS